MVLLLPLFSKLAAHQNATDGWCLNYLKVFLSIYLTMWFTDSAELLGYGMGDRGIRVQFLATGEVFSSSQRSDRAWGSFSLLYSGFWFIPRWWRYLDIDVSTHLKAVPRLRMSGIVPPLPIYVFMVYFVFYIRISKQRTSQELYSCKVETFYATEV
jgi:hypothetical protein